MSTKMLASVHITRLFNEKDLLKGVYIAVVHATRIPPHIGLIIDGKYHSLTVKGRDINTSVNALIKNSVQRKIPTLFIKIKSHSTFSDAYLKEHFITNIQQFPKVDIGIATCLSPIKLFFSETYNMTMDNVNYLFELIPALYAEQLIESASALYIEQQEFNLPVYTKTEINKGISEVRELAVTVRRRNSKE
jgi:hypothetical protein